MVVMDMLQYIRNFFTQGLATRKRPAQDDIEHQINSKYRKVNSPKMSLPGDRLDDLISNSSSSSTRRRRTILNSIPDLRHRLPDTKLDLTTISVDDEDDDVIVLAAKESLKSDKFTSTPNFSSSRRSSNDDITFLRMIDPSPDNRLLLKKRHTLGVNGTKPRFSRNGFSDAISPICNDARPKQKPSRRLAEACPSFRLEEKRAYQHLLHCAAPNYDSSLDSFESYKTPIGKIFTHSASSSRGKRMVESVNKSTERRVQKLIDVIDLTQPLPSKAQNKLSTKDTIKKVIDNFENDSIVIHSDSSDVEVLPTPPSPKPDFPIRRINSLKTFVDPSEPLHDSWAENLLKKHRAALEERNKLIEEEEKLFKKYRDFNLDFRKLKLENDFKQCIKLRETLLPVEYSEEQIPLPQLTREQEHLVDVAFDKYADDGEILARKFNMNIARRDLRTLSGLSWLNDEVINFYMNLIIERGKLDKFPSAYAMNTFFYPKLLKDGHASIRRWTRKIDVFSYDIIAVPIHLRMHWCMALIDLRQKKISYYDSMGSPNKLCLETLLKYLHEEHLDKKKCAIEDSPWTLVNEKGIPQQMNGSDCGMFSCTFAEFISRDAQINFSQEDMPYLRRKMVVEIIEGRLLIS